MKCNGRRPSRAVALGAMLAITLMLGAAPAQAQNRSIGAEGGLGLAAFFATLPYGMAKMVWALGGCMGAGLAWAFTGGDTDPAKRVLTGAVRGDYVLTPDQLTGKEGIEFIGRSPENKEAHESLPNW